MVLSYEFTDYNKFANEIMDINFDSFMIPEDELILKDYAYWKWIT